MFRNIFIVVVDDSPQSSWVAHVIEGIWFTVVEKLIDDDT